ncbi:hypothetical protein K8I31_09840 [bacterium]|nr:hypothetical protein [bacterium]
MIPNILRSQPNLKAFGAGGALVTDMTNAGIGASFTSGFSVGSTTNSGTGVGFGLGVGFTVAVGAGVVVGEIATGSGSEPLHPNKIHPAMTAMANDK